MGGRFKREEARVDDRDEVTASYRPRRREAKLTTFQASRRDHIAFRAPLHGHIDGLHPRRQAYQEHA
jgi:hypothetical protein